MRNLTPVHERSSSVVGPSGPDVVLIGREVVSSGIGDKVTYGGPLHLVLFGPNGSGKGMRVLVPNLLSITGKSIVVIDPKGQLAAMTAKFRHQNGDEVKIIDPFGVVAEMVQGDARYRYLSDHGLIESAGFNPLAALDPGSPSFYDDAAIIAEALIKIQGNDPHWPESAQGLVTGLIMWEKKRNGANANLENVRALLTEADRWETRYDEGTGRTREGMTAGLAVTAARMIRDGGYEIASLGARFANENPTDEMEGVRSAADTQTRWLLSHPMRIDLKKNGVDFRRLKNGNRPMTVYVVLPSKYLESHSIWLRLVVSEALRASLTSGGRRVLLMLDEFAALGHMAIIERLFGVTRDYGIQMWPVFQDLPQLKDLYKNRWETILGMAGVVQSFRAGDMTTAEWLSKRTGSDTVTMASYNQGRSQGSGNWNTNNGMSYQSVQRPTLMPEQMLGMAEGYTLAWYGGQQKPYPVFAPMFTKYVNTLAPRALPNPYYRG